MIGKKIGMISSIIAFALSVNNCAYAASDHYSLHYAYYAPASQNTLNYTCMTAVRTSKSSLRENCTVFSGATHSNGDEAYATYSSYYVSSTGEVSSSLYNTQYHRDTMSTHTITLNRSVPAYSTIYTVYNLRNFSGLNNVLISGDVYE